MILFWRGLVNFFWLIFWCFIDTLVIVMRIEIVKEKITQDDIKKLAQESFGDMVKVVVDIEQGIVAAGGQMHYDSEKVLLESGSKQNNLWGANIYPDREKTERIEYTSLINIRPKDNNRGMEVEDQHIRDHMKKVIDSLIT